MIGICTTPHMSVPVDSIAARIKTAIALPSEITITILDNDYLM